MIVKPSTKADECEALTAFIVSPDFERLPERARKETINRQRGLNGERSTAHILDRQFHNAPDHALLHDLRLPDGIGGFAQFDHVILSRLSRTAAVIEVKNYRGRLSKNGHNEWHVWYEGRRRPIDIPNPLAQARRQREVLRAWLSTRRHEVAFQTIGAFVIIPPDCSIDRSRIGTDVPIYKADNFIAEWMDFGGITPLGRLFSSGVSGKTLLAIGEQLAADHHPDPRGVDELIGLRTRSARAPLDDPDDDRAEEEAAPAVAISTSLEVPGTDAVEPGVLEASAIAALVEREPTPMPTLAPAKPNATAEASAMVAPRIREQELRDGQIAFYAGRNDQVAKDYLEEVCRGRARWNRGSQRWICDDDRALEIKQILAATMLTLVAVAEESPTIAASVDQLEDPAPSAQAGEKALGEASAGVPSRKAGGLIELCPGISKRALPDGRVAFLAAKDDAGAIERLRNACRGRGQWKPLFRNWVCDGNAALLVEQAIAQRQGGPL